MILKLIESRASVTPKPIVKPGRKTPGKKEVQPVHVPKPQPRREPSPEPGKLPVGPCRF